MERDSRAEGEAGSVEDGGQATEFARNAIRHFLDAYVNPELERRQAAGLLEETFRFWGAQVIFFPYARAPDVSINSEMRLRVRVKLKDGTPGKPKGAPLLLGEVGDISEIALDEREDPDCAQAAIFRVGNKWILAFDIHYNRGLSRSHIVAAREFFSAAESSLAQQAWSAFVDNLFSAAELVAKAVLLSVPDPKLRTKHRHGYVQTHFAKRAGGSEYAKTLKGLAKLRPTRKVSQEATLSQCYGGPATPHSCQRDVGYRCGAAGCWIAQTGCAILSLSPGLCE